MVGNYFFVEPVPALTTLVLAIYLVNLNYLIEVSRREEALVDCVSLAEILSNKLENICRADFRWTFFVS